MNIYKYTSNDECVISLEEQEEIVEWVKNNYIKLNSNGFNRYMGSMDKITPHRISKKINCSSKILLM